MSKYQELSPELLRTLLQYDPETGHFFWLERPLSMFQDHGGRYTPEWCQKNFNNKHAGKRALTALSSQGYHTGGILGKVYSAHIVAWAMQYGRWPSMALDHINRIKTDNRIANLREASLSLNGHNRSPVPHSSPYVGVTYYKPTGRWVARVSKGGVSHYIGYFDTPLEAALARDKRSLELYGENAILNFPQKKSPK